MARNYSEQIRTSLAGWLDRDDWNYTFEEEHGFFRFSLNVRGKVRTVQYVVDVGSDSYNVYLLCPVPADFESTEQMHELAEFFCRVNFSLRDGNFELDFNDGEIRYKTYVNCEGSLPSAETVTESIHCPAAMFSAYSSGILGILFNGVPAAEAFRMCEENQRLRSGETGPGEDSRPDETEDRPEPEACPGGSGEDDPDPLSYGGVMELLHLLQERGEKQDDEDEDFDF